MHHPPSVPADAYAPEVTRAGTAASARWAVWLVRLLTLLLSALIRAVPAIRGGVSGTAAAGGSVSSAAGHGHSEWPCLSASAAVIGRGAGMDERAHASSWWDSYWIEPALVSREIRAVSPLVLLLKKASVAIAPRPTGAAASGRMDHHGQSAASGLAPWLRLCVWEIAAGTSH